MKSPPADYDFLKGIPYQKSGTKPTFDLVGNGGVFDYCYYAELMARSSPDREVNMTVINRLAVPKQYKEP
jgi:hypothetical protein